MTVLFWVDAGPTVGFGHLARGLAIAEALVRRGVHCRFLLAADVTALAWVRAAGFRDTVLVSSADRPLPDVLAAAARADAVVVDVKHPLERAEVRAIRGGGRVVVVDNAGPGADEADLVVAPCAAAGAAPDPRRLVGPACVPLRAVPRATPPRTAGAPATVLVSMGGSDPGGLAVPVIEAVAALARTDLVARVVANPGAPVWAALPGLLRGFGYPAPRPVEPGAVGAELATATVAVLAFGVTVYEALAAGVPTVVVCRTAGDAEHAAALAAHGALVSLGASWTPADVRAAVGALLDDPARRQAMRRAGRALVDGRGAERVAERLLRLLVGDGEGDGRRRLRA